MVYFSLRSAKTLMKMGHYLSCPIMKEGIFYKTQWHIPVSYYRQVPLPAVIAKEFVLFLTSVPTVLVFGSQLLWVHCGKQQSATFLIPLPYT